MEEIVEKVTNFNLKDLKKITFEGNRQSFRVVESDSPNCILKKIPQLKGLVLDIVQEREAWRITKSTKFNFGLS